MDVLDDIAKQIDSAVLDLMLAELQAQGREQASAHTTARARIEEFREQVLGDLGGVACKVDKLLQLHAAGANPYLRKFEPPISASSTCTIETRDFGRFSQGYPLRISSALFAPFIYGAA
jgi:hypothetical protein